MALQLYKHTEYGRARKRQQYCRVRLLAYRVTIEYRGRCWYAAGNGVTRCRWRGLRATGGGRRGVLLSVKAKAEREMLC